jgi:hypothetical protein
MLIPLFFAAFCPEACNSKTSIQKKKDCKNDLNLLGKIMEARTYKYKNPKYEIKQDN